MLPQYVQPVAVWKWQQQSHQWISVILCFIWNTHATMLAGDGEVQELMRSDCGFTWLFWSLVHIYIFWERKKKKKKIMILMHFILGLVPMFGWLLSLWMSVFRCARALPLIANPTGVTEGNLCPSLLCFLFIFPLLASSHIQRTSVCVAHLADSYWWHKLGTLLLAGWASYVLLPGISRVCDQKCLSSICGCMAMLQVKTKAEHKQFP